MNHCGIDKLYWLIFLTHGNKNDLVGPFMLSGFCVDPFWNQYVVFGSDRVMLVWFEKKKKEQKKKSRCPLLIESLLDRSLFCRFFGLFSNIWDFLTWLQTKTKQQISTARLTSKLAILQPWINQQVVVGVRGSEGSAVLRVSISSPVIRCEAFVLNQGPLSLTRSVMGQLPKSIHWSGSRTAKVIEIKF